MVELPAVPTPTRDAIFAAYEADADTGFRPHLGASQIGRSCERALWYDFRWTTPARFPGRILRLFETGQLEEARIVRNLRRIGATVLEVDPETGRQWRVEAHGGHFGGSLDAVALGLIEAPKTWHVLEFKTHSAKSFRELTAKGVAEAKPQHWAQMQVYMHLTGLTRAMYLAVCKDTDDLHIERVRADTDAAARLLAKAARIIGAARPPARISEDPTWFECRFCDHHDLCHDEGAAAVSCRSCLHATSVEGGWHCARWDQALDVDTQRQGCARHLFIPVLVPGEVVDAGDDHVLYRMRDGATWVNDARAEAVGMLTLRPYQQAAIDAIYGYFAENTGHPLIVIPTAGGKSLVMAAFVEGVLRAWPDQRILIVTHVRELIAQNFAELIGLWRDAPAGIFSAGIGRRDLGARILFAGIQSIHRRAYDVQQCDLVLIDEAHLIPAAADTMYRRFLDTLARINPQLKVIGFTATPYRLDSGMLHEGRGALFTDIAYEVSVRQLIDDGYLCPLVSKAAETKLDVSGVGSRGGEFIPGQLQAAVDLPEITEAAIDEVVRLGADRRSWLAFCAGVEHATHVAEASRARGFTAATIFGDTPKPERDRIIAAFKRGEIRALASMGVLTTGFNAPGVDLIAMLRPTKSTGLYVQMAGRGTRLAPGKTDCLVLDFAGNVARHGPIDAVKPKRPGSGEGDAPCKVCPDCQSILATAVRVCPDCGHAFPPPIVKVEAEASTLAILTTGKPQWLSVDGVSYRAHEKPGGRTTLQVDYQCGLVRHREWVCFEHTGYARQKAVAWWRQRARGLAVPSTVTEALAWSRQISAPTEIAVRPQGRFTEIVSARFAPCPPASAPSATASPAASAGSTPVSRCPTPVATAPAAGSAAGAARTSAIGDAA